jgi:hypothetical protein
MILKLLPRLSAYEFSFSVPVVSGFPVFISAIPYLLLYFNVLFLIINLICRVFAINIQVTEPDQGKLGGSSTNGMAPTLTNKSSRNFYNLL